MTQINDEWSFRGTSLHGTNWNIRMLSPTEMVPGRRGENVMVPSLDGRIYRNKAMEQRTVSLAMFVKGSGGSALERDIETLKALFGRPGEGVLSRTVAGRTVPWTIDAEVANVVEFVPESDLLYNLVVDFVCADPYWSGSLYNTISGNITSSPGTFTVTNNGTAVNERMSIWLTGGITNPKLTVGDYWLQYNGTVVAGNTLEIDCSKFTCWYGGADHTDDITHGGGLRWMRYLPGANTVTLTGTGLGTVLVTTEFTELWL